MQYWRVLVVRLCRVPNYCIREGSEKKRSTSVPLLDDHDAELKLCAFVRAPL